MSQKLKQSGKIRMRQRLAVAAAALAMVGFCTVLSGFVVAKAGELSVTLDVDNLSVEQTVSEKEVEPVEIENSSLSEKLPVAEKDETADAEEDLLGERLPEGNEYVTGDADLYLVDPSEYEDYDIIEMPLPEIGYLATVHMLQWTLPKQYIKMTDLFYIEKGSVFTYTLYFDSSVRMFAGLVLPSGALAGYYMYDKSTKAIKANVSGYFRFFVQHQWTAPEEVHVSAMYKWE